MIQTVRFRNFKALRHVDIPLQRFTVLVGPNASGKTSALQGLHLLTQAAYASPPEIFAGQPWKDPAALLSRGAADPLELGFRGSWSGDAGTLAAAAGDFLDASRLFEAAAATTARPPKGGISMRKA